MLPEKLTLEVVTPERRVLVETVDEVVLPGRLGYLGVLPGHAPLLTSLAVGELEYRAGGTKHYVAISEGFAEILPSKVIVLAGTAEKAEEIDLDRARKKKEEVEGGMKGATGMLDFSRENVRLQKAVTRIQVARRSSG